MNSNREFHYFSTSIRLIIKQKYLISFIVLLDYLFVLINIPFIIHSNSYYSKINLFSMLSPLYKQKQIPLLSLSISLTALFYMCLITKRYFISRNCQVFLSLFVSFYELILIRLLSLGFLDIYISTIAYLATHQSLINTILSFAFGFITLIYIKLNIHHFHLYNSFGYATFEYPFDSFSQSTDIVMLLIKLCTSIDSNTSNLFIQNLLRGLIITMTILLLFYSLFIMHSYSFLIIQNLFYNKIRIVVLLFTVLLSLFEYIYSLEKPIYLLILLNITILFVSLYIIFSYDNFYSLPLQNKNMIVILLHYSRIGNQSLQKKILFAIVEKLSLHHSRCNNCEVCTVFSVRLNAKQEFTFESLISLYKDLNKENSVYFNIITLMMQSISPSEIKEKTTLHHYYFNLRIKLYHFMRIYFDSNPSMVMTVFHIFNDKLDNNNKANDYDTKPVELEIINNFIIKFETTLDKMLELLNNTLHIQTPKIIYVLTHMIKELKEKKYKAVLQNKHSDQHYTCLILSIIYEEFLNTTINRGYQIIEEEVMFEEILISHYNTDKHIIFKVNFLTWETEIIQVGHDLIKYKNKELKEIFPSEFASQQIESIKSKFDKEDNYILLVLKNIKSGKNKDSFIHELDDLKNNSMECSRTIRKMYFLDLTIIKISYCSILDTVLILGVYQLNKSDLIIMKKSNDTKDMLYGVNYLSSIFNYSAMTSKIDLNGISNYATSKLLFTIQNYSTLFSIVQLEINNTKSIYFNKASNKTTTQTKRNNNDLDLMNYNDNQYEMNWDLLNTQSMSSVNAPSSMISNQSHSNSVLGYQNLQKKVKNKRWIRRIIAFLLSFSIGLICYSFITMYFEIQMTNNLKNTYDVFTALRNINRQSYHTISSILSAICIGRLKTPKCINYMKTYNYRINQTYNFDIDLVSLLYQENVLKLKDLKNKSTIVEKSLYTLRDSETQKQFENTFHFYQLRIINGTIQYLPVFITFKEGMNRLLNSMTIILQSKNYTSTPLYIINLRPLNFSNVFKPELTSLIQLELYSTIANFANYFVQWSGIYNSLIHKVYSDLFYLRNIVLVIMLGSLIFHLLLIGMIYFLVHFYWNNYVGVINYIQKCKSSQVFFDIYKHKINILKQLLYLYKEDPLVLIKEIKGCDQKYNLSKSIKKKQAQSMDQKNKEQQDKMALMRQTHYFSNRDLWFVFSKYIISLLTLFIYYCIFFIAFYLLWNTTIKQINLAYQYIDKNARAESTVFSVFTFLQISIYGNQTRQNISALMNSTDPDYYVKGLYESFDVFFSMDKIQRPIRHLVHQLSDDFTLSCNTFYIQTKDGRFTKLIAKSNGTLLVQFVLICNSFFSSMNYNDEVIIYKDYAKTLINIILGMKWYSYHDLELLLSQDAFHFAELFTHLVFRPLRLYINNWTYTNGTSTIKKTMSNIIKSYAMISSFCDILFLVVLCAGFIIHLYAIEMNSKRLQSVFKVSFKSNQHSD